MPTVQYYAKKYIRLSHADEKAKKDGKSRENESDSVTNQCAVLDSFIAQNPDIQDMGEKVDDGYSGIIFDRPAFKELMDEIHAGKINCVIVKDLSRLGREYIETGNYLRHIFPKLGVRFIALGDNIDTAKGTQGDDMMVTVKSVVNDSYCRDISNKTRLSLAAKRRSGDYVGAFAMYGYRKGEEDKNQLVVDEYPAGIVREIYRMKIDGLSASAIAEELNRRGVLSPLEYKKDRGLPHAKYGVSDVPDAQWTPKAVIRILHDETYTGTLVQGRRSTPSYKVRQVLLKPSAEWVRFEGAHKAVVSQEDYGLVQYLCKLDTRAADGDQQAHLFSGLLVCKGCGARMTRKIVPYKGKKYVYWYCPNGRHHQSIIPDQPPPKPVMVRDDLLAECVLESLKAHVANVVSLDNLLAESRAKRAQSALARQHQAQIEESRRRIEKAAANDAGLYGHLVDGILTKEEYRDLKKSYAEEVNKAQAAMDASQDALERVLSGGDGRLQWMERFRAFAGLTELDRRTVVHFIHSITVKRKDELEIAFNYQQHYETALARFLAPAGANSGGEVA